MPPVVNASFDFLGDDVLTKPRARDHTAHLYTDSESLLSALEQFVSAALDRGDAAVAIATQAHIDGLLGRLDRDNRDCRALRDRGQLVCINAEECLASIMDGCEPRHDVFQSVMTDMIEKAQRGFGRLCAYGELVNILWHQSNREAAHALEVWWNSLIGHYGFTLLCGYRMSSLDEGAQDSLETICRTHSHLIPALDSERFDRAVEAALQETIPNGQIAALRKDLASQFRRSTRMPSAQAALFALNDILPSLAKDVRMLARGYYSRQSS